MKKLFLSFYLSKKFFAIAACICLLFAVSFFIPFLFLVAQFCLVIVLCFVLIDVVILYSKKGVAANRICKQRFSNADNNIVKIEVENKYFVPIIINVIEELPAQLLYQIKRLPLLQLSQKSKGNIEYNLKPNSRGEYDFGNTLLFVQSSVGLVTRRFIFNTAQKINVYPSFIKMQSNSLQGVSNQLLYGSKKVRKIGNSLEFEQIKDYVQGDDVRTINWKASARKNQLMVNTYIDEKSQQVYCIIDKSRNMKMPFEEMTLLDYAINSSLAISKVAIDKHDKIGLVSFAEKLDSFIVADSKPKQMEVLMQSLYKQQTLFKDADFETLYANIRNKIKQRSLLVLFTNFESQYSLQRQLPYLKAIAQFHLLVVVFFENTELKTLIESNATNTEEIYIQTIASKFSYEKKLMLKELRHHGIVGLLTTPQSLTTNVINKYLEIKNKQAL